MVVKRSRKWATDHRAVVLESIATSPWLATHDSIAADCVSTEFTRKSVMTMLNQLQREGLVGRVDPGFFVTRAGFSWLTEGRFDRKLPEYAERPGSRKPKKV